MNKWLLLLVVGGLAFAGWYYREKLPWFGGKKAEPGAEVAAGSAEVKVNPAKESQALATQMYPALGVPGSPFNVRFVRAFNQMKGLNSDVLAQADWPMQLATRVAAEMKSEQVLAVPTPPPARFGSSLDPKVTYPGVPTPTPWTLPGLQGSSLDQRSHSTKVH